MKKETFYKASIFFLLAVNLVLISIGTIHLAKGHDHIMHPKETAKEILQLDEKQHTLFLDLANDHIKKMNAFDQEQKKLLSGYFAQTYDSNNVTNIDSVLVPYSVIEKQKLQSTKEHLKDIKKLLREDQLHYYQDFVDHSLKMILGKSRNRRPPKKDFHN